MKKILCIAVAVLIIFGCTATGFAAEGKTFEIPALHMTVSIPNGEGMATCVTDGECNDAMIEYLAAQGITEEDFNVYAAQNIIAFTAMDPMGAYEYSITSIANSDTEYIYDMNTLSVADLDEMMKAASGVSDMDDLDQDTIQDMRDRGASISEIEHINVDAVEELNGHKYIVSTMNGSAEGDNIWMDMYATVKNGEYIYIRLISYGSPPTEEQRAGLKMVAQSAEYERIPAAGKTYEKDKRTSRYDPFSRLFSKLFVWLIIGAVLMIVAIVRSKKKQKR